MNAINRVLTGSILIFSIFTPAVFAANGSITILDPRDGAQLASGTGNKLEYDGILSPTANHLEISIDDQSPMIVDKVTNCPCSIELPRLSAGNHRITVQEATAQRAPASTGSTITVSVK